MSKTISISGVGKGLDLTPKKSITVVLQLLKINIETGDATPLFTGTDIPVIPVAGDVITAPDGVLYQVFQREVSFELDEITQERSQRVICGCTTIEELLKSANTEGVKS